MQIPYKIAKSFGKVRVKYACPKCKEVLENELAEAGQKDTCPTCGLAFVVPGVEKRKELEAELAQKAEERRIAKEQARVEAAERKAAKEEAARKKRELAEAAAAKQSENAFQPSYVAAKATPKPKYPALEFYRTALSVLGGFVIAGGLGLVVIFWVGFVAQTTQEGAGLVGGAFGAIVATIIIGLATMITALPFFAASQLIGLAVDARLDLHHIANSRG